MNFRWGNTVVMPIINCAHRNNARCETRHRRKIEDEKNKQFSTEVMDIALNDLFLLDQTNSNSAHCAQNRCSCSGFSFSECVRLCEHQTLAFNMKTEEEKKRAVRSDFTHTPHPSCPASHCPFPSNARICIRLFAILHLLVAFILQLLALFLLLFLLRMQKPAPPMPLLPLKIQNYCEITEWHLAWRL